MTKPTLFGCTLTIGLRSKVAKKHIRKRWRHIFPTEEKYHSWMKDMAKITVGDLIQGCSGLNERITAVEPDYWRVGHGYVLGDVSVECASGTACSAKNCGVDLPKTYEECLQYVQGMINNPNDPDDEWGFKKRYSKLKINPDGTYSEPDKDMEP